MLARCLALVAAIAVLSLGARAHAHRLVDAGTQALGRARFGEAITLYDRAAAGDELTRPDLVRLLEGRALARRAVGDEDGARDDLDRLAAIDPEHTFARHVPPEIVDIFRTLRDAREGPLRVRVQVALDGDRALVRAVLVHDPGGLVVHTRLAARAGEGAWRQDDDGELELALPPGATLEYTVEAIGLGGVSLLELGSRETPLPALLAVQRGGRSIDPGDGGEVTPWLVGIGGVVVGAVIAGVIVGFAMSGPSNDTALSPPRLGAP